MNKFYTVLTAAALAAGVSASAKVADLQINEALREYAPQTVATQINKTVAPNVEANLSRADHWCEGAMYHYNNSFYRLDQFELPVDRVNDGEDVVYTVHGMFPSQNNPNGSSIQFIIHPDNTINVPVQEGPWIPDFWGFVEGAPEGLTNGYGYVCDIATGNNALNPELGPLMPNAPQNVLQETSFYDPETGLAHLMTLIFFQYDGLKLNDGRVLDTLYPFDFILPYPEDGYNILRAESMQLGDWGNTQEVNYTDSYLPHLGFDVETYKVTLQQNTKFPSTFRMLHPFINNTQLLAADFITDGSGTPIDAAMLIYAFDEDEIFLGKTYAGLNIEGMTPAQFEFDSYVNYMLANGITKQELESMTEISNNGSILYDGKPFGKLDNGFVTIPEYCNFYVAMTEYSDTKSGFVMMLPEDAPYFVPNDFFKLQWPYGGVEAVTADNENAPVEYYNLQGIRVNTTTAGNVYIRRQGSDVTKVLF